MNDKIVNVKIARSSVADEEKKINTFEKSLFHID